MRYTIMFFVIVGSLAVNILIYFLANYYVPVPCVPPSNFDKFINAINPTFDFLKRLNGFYIFIYIISAQNYWKILKEASKCNRKMTTPPTEGTEGAMT